MKKIITLIAILLFMSCAGLKPPTEFSAETFLKEEVIEPLASTQNELFVIANDWMVDTFNSAESVIQFTDKESGTIIGKYLIQGTIQQTSYGTTTDTRIFAKITIKLKDYKAKITIIPTTTIYVHKKDYEQVIEQKINNVLNSFIIKIKTTKTNW